MFARRPVEPLAELVDVHKHFGQIHALRGIDLQIHPGEVLALLGPNGAGKTTAISILLGLRRPEQGQVRLLGTDPLAPGARRRIGATPQETGFPSTLKVREAVELVRAHYEHPRSTEELLAQVGLANLKERQTGGLSGGEKRRLAVALAFAGDPVVVFLDEPTTGLDVESRHDLWQAIREYRGNGGTVLLTTHYLEEADELATSVAVIARGQIVAQGSVDEIKARTQAKCVRLKAASLPELPGITRIEHADGVYALYTSDPDELVRALVARQVPFCDLEIVQTTLEQAFLDLTREER